MANIPPDLKYTDQHEWLKIEDGVATVGITDYAQEQLTDIVFVELPEVGLLVKPGEGLAVLESVKSVADVYAPLGGEVVAVNDGLEDHPEWINEDAFGEGWIYKLKLNTPDPSGLLDAAGYEAFLAEQ